jgi:hypothetical protein
MTPDDPAAQFATRITNTIFGVVGTVVVAGVTLWMLFHREEWHVGKGYVEHRRSLFGMDRGHTFRMGIIRLKVYDHGGGSMLCRVSVLDREKSLTLCEEHSDSAARAMATLLAQRTGWVLDDHIHDFSWIAKANRLFGWVRTG